MNDNTMDYFESVIVLIRSLKNGSHARKETTELSLFDK